MFNRVRTVVYLVTYIGLFASGLQNETVRVSSPVEWKESVNHGCPTGFIPLSNHTGGCKCGYQKIDTGVEVKCDQSSNQSLLLRGFMTYLYGLGFAFD